MTNTELHNLAAHVRVELGTEWIYFPTRYDGELTRWAELHHPSGMEIHLAMIDEWKKSGGRLNVTGGYPDAVQSSGRQRVMPSDLWNPSEEVPSITLAPTKTAAQIARDIERRFLPEYSRIWSRCKAKSDQDSAWEDGRVRTRAELNAIDGIKMDIRKDSWSGMRGHLTLGSLQYEPIEVCGPNSVSFKLSGLTVDQVRAIINLLWKAAMKPEVYTVRWYEDEARRLKHERDSNLADAEKLVAYLNNLPPGEVYDVTLRRLP